MSRILVIDDQNIPRVAVTTILEEAGHEVTAAADGEEGLRIAAEILPDVVVLDVYMPGLDGFAVVERLKQDPRTAPAPVIFLTAEPPTDELIVRGLDLGASDFISKGCSRAELLARVGVMARIKRGNDELFAVARISDTLIQSLDPQKLSSRFVQQVSETFRARGALLAFWRDADTPPHYALFGADVEEPLVEAFTRSVQVILEESFGDHAEIAAQSLRGPAGLLARRLELDRVLAVRVDHATLPPTLLAVLLAGKAGIGASGDASLLHLLARQATIALDNALLHERTRDQAKLMEEQAEKLERAMTERSRFFASMSHELRTPINAVIGYNQLLELGAYGEMTPEQTNAIVRVSRSAQHLLELINDVLDISKIEAGKMEVHVETANLKFLIDDTISTVQLQADTKGLILEVVSDKEAEIRTDAARVRQILLNLLSNAVKFTSAGKVRVQLHRRGEMYRIEVTDTGPGIHPDDRTRVFEEFEQTQSSASGGTGLGLPISKRLAHLLGGELTLESEVGVGSTFILTLPNVFSPPVAPAP
jgi:signal transduction histidine kinase